MLIECIEKPKQTDGQKCQWAMLSSLKIALTVLNANYLFVRSIFIVFFYWLVCLKNGNFGL